ncbi:VOC family protein [Peterkaempfera bronchialis]|uniref:VOC family protein n=1 Tax=Peterkaempfera bronchialis TaxID=2126346 RepID=A0A345T3C5_9ACTN|nr:VOC family protein [Peterkaempfera bronchialis]AXI80480.1 VOC family protein [Peterkaempfera bronchialis]
MVTPAAMNHIAYQTTDLAATHAFWTKALGARLAGAVRQDAAITSSGESMNPFLHVFYELAGGECIAFFDVAGEYQAKDDGLEWWAKHLALSVSSQEELAAVAQQLRDHGVEVRGPVDHDGLWYSVYCFDPNGVHLEITHQTRPLGEPDAIEARSLYDTWLADRAAERV